MSQPTSAVSLRITEEDLALLDAQVGLKGSRNRSDVVRMAIQELPPQPPTPTGYGNHSNPVGPPRPTTTWETLRVAWSPLPNSPPKKESNSTSPRLQASLGADQ